MIKSGKNIKGNLLVLIVNFDKSLARKMICEIFYRLLELLDLYWINEA